ncbi:MAG: GNAT family N-acetyltransferase [Myxococcota bacterium]
MRIDVSVLRPGSAGQAWPPPDFAHCVAIRTQVFVQGQGVSMEEEIDGLDPECVHLLARVDAAPVGTARLRRKGGDAKAERVAVLEVHQRAGIGSALMRALESEARRMRLPRVILHAQLRAVPFYESLGYVAFGPVFDEAEIPHRKMERRLGTAETRTRDADPGS